MFGEASTRSANHAPRRRTGRTFGFGNFCAFFPKREDASVARPVGGGKKGINRDG